MYAPTSRPSLSSLSAFLMTGTAGANVGRRCAGSGTGRMSLLLRSGLLSLPLVLFLPVSLLLLPGAPLSVVLRCCCSPSHIRCCETVPLWYVKGQPRSSAALGPRRQSRSAEVGGGSEILPRFQLCTQRGVHCSRDVTGCYTPSGSSNQ